MPDPRRVPTQLKVLRGNPGKKQIKPEPMPKLLPDVPEPPDYLCALACEQWRKLAPELHRLRLLTVLDLESFALYCAAFARWRTVELMLADEAEADPNSKGFVRETDKGNAVKNPLLAISSQAAKEMIIYAGHFGLSPIARSRIGSAGYEGKPPGKFDGLLAG